MYDSPTLTADSNTLAAVQSQLFASLWVVPQGEAARARQVTSGTGNYDGIAGVALAPDGRMVYCSNASGNTDLWSAAADGSNPRQLTVAPLIDENPKITADGRTILFVSDRTGSPNIWRMDLDGSNQTQLTRGDSDSSYDVSPDAQWVVFSSARTGKMTLWRVSIEGGEPRALAGA